MTTTTRVSEIKHEQFHMTSILIEISHIVNNVKKCRIISFLPFSLMNVKCACNLNTIQETKQSLKNHTSQDSRENKLLMNGIYSCFI